MVFETDLDQLFVGFDICAVLNPCLVFFFF